MTRKRYQTIILAIVGLGFLTVGLALCVSLVSTLRNAGKLANAIEVRAHILDVSVTVHQGRGSSTAITHAKYAFQYAGRTYESTKLGLFSESQVPYDFLQRAKDAQTTVPCYVAPDDPSVSVLDKHFTLWPLTAAILFAVVFTGIGMLCLWQSCRDFTTWSRTRPLNATDYPRELG
jgi:hypothetical protein